MDDHALTGGRDSHLLLRVRTMMVNSKVSSHNSFTDSSILRHWKAQVFFQFVINIAYITPALAEFNLNFLPETSRYEDPEWLNFNCNRPRAPGGGFEDCDDNDEFRGNNGSDLTSFLLERVRDPGTSDQYYHTIVGLPGDDFYQEAYVKITRYMNDNGGWSTSPREVDDLGPISDSMGNWRDITESQDNAYDPLGPAYFSGSGTANPKSTQFRQVVDSEGVYQDITKAHFTLKHIIAQTIDSGSVFHEFEIDMTNSNFDQDHIAGQMNKNYLLIADASFNSEFDILNIGDAGAGNIPSANPNSVVDISGGKYKYVNKYQSTLSGTSFDNEYEGEGAGYNIWEENWKHWRNASQNIGHLYGRSGGD